MKENIGALEKNVILINCKFSELLIADKNIFISIHSSAFVHFTYCLLLISVANSQLKRTLMFPCGWATRTRVHPES